MKKGWIVFLLLATVFLFSGCQKSIEEVVFTEDDALALEKAFRNALIQETIPSEEADADLHEDEPIILKTLVRDFNDKESLVEYLQSYMSEKLAIEYTDAFYEERNGELHLIPTESPVWITEEEPFELIELENGKYQLTQAAESVVFGTYTLIVTYAKKDEIWIIEDRALES